MSMSLATSSNHTDMFKLTILRITDRVYIKAPKNTKVTSYYVEERGRGRYIDQIAFADTALINPVFTYNNLHWETDSLMIDIIVSDSGSAKNVSNYVETIEMTFLKHHWT